MDSKNWIIKNNRPENSFTPEHFYNLNEATRYAKSSSMRREQEKITLRLLELLNIPLDSKLKILDAGCGTGYSMVLLNSLFPNAIIKGFDISSDMLSFAKKKKLKVKQGSLLVFPYPEKFDFILSVSVLQWISKEKIPQVAEQFFKHCKKHGFIGIQYYPDSEKRLFEDAKEFKKKGFSVTIMQDNYYLPVKRKVFLLLRK